MLMIIVSKTILLVLFPHSRLKSGTPPLNLPFPSCLVLKESKQINQCLSLMLQETTDHLQKSWLQAEQLKITDSLSQYSETLYRSKEWGTDICRHLLKTSQRECIRLEVPIHLTCMPGRVIQKRHNSTNECQSHKEKTLGQESHWVIEVTLGQGKDYDPWLHW